MVTDTDIAGLSNRNPATFPTNDPTNPLHRLADDLQCGRLKVEGVKEDVTYALSTLERQAAEIKRLRGALTMAKGPLGSTGPTPVYEAVLAALTGEDTATLSLSGKTQTDDRTRGDG